MTSNNTLRTAFLLAVLPFSVGYALVPSPMSAYADPASHVDGSDSSFTVRNQLQVPGKTLSAGTYTIRMVDHLHDRMIVRVERNGKSQTTFLALPKSSLPSTTRGPIAFTSTSAMRGFVFPDGTVAEFVYPKGEAVSLAKSNHTTIPAIDPASEGRPDAAKLSKDDMQMITLWMLTPTPVGPDASDPGIVAAKYQQADTRQSNDLAATNIPPRAHPHLRPVMAALPHTAGEMPLVMLTGIMAFCGAGWLRRRRAL